MLMMFRHGARGHIVFGRRRLDPTQTQLTRGGADISCESAAFHTRRSLGVPLRDPRSNINIRNYQGCTRMCEVHAVGSHKRCARV